MPASLKLIEGKPEDLTLEEVTELFNFLRAKDLYLEVEIIMVLMRVLYDCSEQDLELFQLCLEEPSEDGFVNADQFHMLVSSGDGFATIHELHAKRVALASPTDKSGIQVERDLLLRSISWRVDRDDALSTLPFTLFYMVIFMCLVIIHLRIWDRQQLERGMEHWISSYSHGMHGPYMERHVSDVESWFHWLEASGLPALLDSMQNGTQGFSAHLALSSTLIGDIQMTQRRFDGAVRSSWLLHSAAGATHLSSHPGDFLAAARAASRSFRSEGWPDNKILDTGITFVTLAGHSSMFLLTKVELLVGDYGRVLTSVCPSSIPTDPYLSQWSFLLDVLYLLLLLYIMCNELWEMHLVGLHGLSDYWSFWNLVDWVSILLGLVNGGLWISSCLAMSTPALRALMDGRSLRHSIMELAESELDAAVRGLEAVWLQLFLLHIFVAANTASIIMRFFKAFAANARLNVVATTFKSCYEEIVHFLIVFVILFLCMTIIAHVLFGSDVREFNTIGSSINTGFMVLMGDFGWYVELSAKSHWLPSGIPRILVQIWFCSYMGFVSIVMINMLLAIILEKYSEVGQETVKLDSRTLWSQAARFVQRFKETWGFVPLARIRSQLQDKLEPAHPDSRVTKGSLKAAFEGMKDEQAEWLINWLKTEAFLEETSERHSPEVRRLHRTRRLLQKMSAQLEDLHLFARSTRERLEQCEQRAARCEAAASWRASTEGREPLASNQPPTSSPQVLSQCPLMSAREMPESCWSQKQTQLLCCFTQDNLNHLAQTPLKEASE